MSAGTTLGDVETASRQPKLYLDLLLIGAAISCIFIAFPVLNLETVFGAIQDRASDLHWFFDYSPQTWQEAMIFPLFVSLVAFGISQLAPMDWKPARCAVSAIILGLGVRYFMWRFFHTLGAEDPVTLIMRVVCFVVEFTVFLNIPFVLLQISCPTNRTKEADELEQQIQDEQYYPSVDVLIPSYNEPPDLLRRTIVACQAIDYPNKTVYLLDDTRRDEVRDLCAELNCNYVRRPDNKGAKAGNVNNTLQLHARGDLICLFDADFLPTKQFLRRTVGFFMDDKVALVQTPQTFYNPDPVQRNLGLNRVMRHEEDLFFRLVQAGRDFFNSSICHGTSFIVRRKYVDEIGGFATESISEDFFTSVKLMARGYTIKYLNEPLSAGASAMNVDGFVLQRMRWAQGTLQILFCDVNPLRLPGLTPVQRFLNLAGVMHWIAGAASFFMLILPIPLLFLDIAPMHARAAETVLFFLPYYAFYSLMFRWFTLGCRTFFFSDLYGPIIAFQLMRTTLITMLNPFKAKFTVTQKHKAGSIHVSWWLMKPLMIFIALYGIGFFKFLTSSPLIENDGDSAGMILSWCVYNVIVLLLSAFACVNLPDKTKFGTIEQPVEAQLLVAGRLNNVEVIDLDEEEAILHISTMPAFYAMRGPHHDHGELLLEGARATPFKVMWTQDTYIGVKLDYTGVEQQRRVFELIYSKQHYWSGKAA